MKKSSDPSQWDDKDWAYHNKKVSEWNEIEWENVYALYSSSQLWGLDSFETLNSFTVKHFNN